jgi:3-oxoadipate enol-lactonase
MMMLNIKDFKLHVEDLGHPKGEAVVFLNGVMASTSSWYTLMKYFVKNDFRVVLHDFKGQLRSDHPDGPYTFQEHAEETIMILKQLGIHQAHFVGTSYGGEVALNIGFRYPEYVKSMMVIDSTSEIDPMMRTEIERWIELCKLKDGYHFFKGISKSIYGKDYIKRNKVMMEERAKATSKVPESYFDGQITLYETFINDVNMTDRLHEIKAPTLVVCGDQDHLKPLKCSLRIHKEIEGSEMVVLKDCGHVAIFEKPDELQTLMIGFIHKHMQKTSNTRS